MVRKLLIIIVIFTSLTVKSQTTPVTTDYRWGIAMTDSLVLKALDDTLWQINVVDKVNFHFWDSIYKFQTADNNGNKYWMYFLKVDKNDNRYLANQSYRDFIEKWVIYSKDVDILQPTFQATKLVP